MGEGLVVRHVDDLEWVQVRAQRSADGTAGVWNRFVDYTDNQMVIYTRYDAGMVLAKHGHVSDQVVFVVEGSMHVGDQLWTKGTVGILDAGTQFGPIVSGPEGVLILEVFNGSTKRASQDAEGYAEVIAARGIEPLPDPAFTMPVQRERVR